MHLLMPMTLRLFRPPSKRRRPTTIISIIGLISHQRMIAGTMQGISSSAAAAAAAEPPISSSLSPADVDVDTNSIDIDTNYDTIHRVISETVWRKAARDHWNQIRDILRPGLTSVDHPLNTGLQRQQRQRERRQEREQRKRKTTNIHTEHEKRAT